MYLSPSTVDVDQHGKVKRGIISLTRHSGASDVVSVISLVVSVGGWGKEIRYRYDPGPPIKFNSFKLQQLRK